MTLVNASLNSGMRDCAEIWQRNQTERLKLYLKVGYKYSYKLLIKYCVTVNIYEDGNIAKI